jgi:hypothetical protein
LEYRFVVSLHPLIALGHTQGGVKDNLVVEFIFAEQPQLVDQRLEGHCLSLVVDP